MNRFTGREGRERAVRLVFEQQKEYASDRGGQYLSTLCETFSASEYDASVGSTGDSYDNALAEATNGLFKNKVIRHHNPWQNIADRAVPRPDRRYRRYTLLLHKESTLSQSVD